MVRLLQDLRFAARTLTRAPFVTLLALLAFALGIGVTTAVFSIFNGVLLKPLPFPDPEELVAVYDTQPACATCPASFPKYIDWKTRNQVFSAIGGSMQAAFALTGSGDPVRVSGVAATASLVTSSAFARSWADGSPSRKISLVDRRSSCCRTSSGRASSAPTPAWSAGT
jgi:putative ABC transport system permease protein